MERILRVASKIEGIRIILSCIVLAAMTTLAAPVSSLAEPIIPVRRTRVVQVDLTRAPKISQFVHIDSTAQGFGKNACGLVAAAAAVGGADWQALVTRIANAAGDDYGDETGIQPSNYVRVLREVFGTENVNVREATTLERLYDELAAGNVVIVDLKVNFNTQSPSASTPNFAHFARVLGMDMERQEIYIENTLRGGVYWTMTLSNFEAAWDRPETTSSLIPEPHAAEDVTRWAVILDKGLITEDSQF